MSPDDAPGLSGHVLDLSALTHLAAGESLYGREVVRQAAVYGVTLLVPVLAAQYLAAYHAGKGSALLNLSIILIAPFDSVHLAVTTPFTETLDRNARRLSTDLTERERVLTVLVAAHAIHLSQSRGWRLLTATPSLYEGIDVRTEILP
ncbi:hypothetical protein GCM10010404_90030 [Nonomuraea africana]|uniref:PIN domain-containing protein n=1 Tax=Nonomuraea africana TaxID=46171 RepID=A0ABR9KF02_9ACTN|nr:hypothetical protein [Nonomuraea africana]MBE1560112.1 hypothetical protein [Nonomuraea africana]